MGVGGGALSDRFQLRLERIEKPQLTIKGGAALRVERDRGAAQPGEVFAGEQIASGSFNEPLVKEAVDAILDARAVVHEHGTFGGALAHAAGFIRRNPDAGEEVGTEEWGENEGVDFVGFDFGLGDGFGAHGVADDDFFDEGLEECGDGPGVGGGFQSDAVLGSEVLTGEGSRTGPMARKRWRWRTLPASSMSTAWISFLWMSRPQKRGILISLLLLSEGWRLESGAQAG